MDMDRLATEQMKNNFAVCIGYCTQSGLLASCFRDLRDATYSPEGKPQGDKFIISTSRKSLNN